MTAVEEKKKNQSNLFKLSLSVTLRWSLGSTSFEITGTQLAQKWNCCNTHKTCIKEYLRFNLCQHHKEWDALRNNTQAKLVQCIQDQDKGEVLFRKQRLKEPKEKIQIVKLCVFKVWISSEKLCIYGQTTYEFNV